MSRLASRQNPQIRIVLEPGMAVGDGVRLSLDEAHLLRAAVLAYLLPLLGLLSGAILGHILGGEKMSLAFGIAACAIGWIGARLLARRFVHGLQPSITRL